MLLNNVAMQMLQKMPVFQQINPLIQMLQGSSNPMGLLTQKFGNNPAFKKAIEVAKGKSPQELEEFVKNTFYTQTNIKF